MLVQKPGGAEFLGQVGPQHRHRDVTIVLEVVVQKDARHPALAQLALEAVPRGQGVAKSFRKLGHGASISPRRPGPGEGDLYSFVANISVLPPLAREGRAAWTTNQILRIAAGANHLRVRRVSSRTGVRNRIGRSAGTWCWWRRPG